MYRERQDLLYFQCRASHHVVVRFRSVFLHSCCHLMYAVANTHTEDVHVRVCVCVCERVCVCACVVGVRLREGQMSTPVADLANY